jgi:hypothetical protein
VWWCVSRSSRSCHARSSVGRSQDIEGWYHVLRDRRDVLGVTKAC